METFFYSCAQIKIFIPKTALYLDESWTNNKFCVVPQFISPWSLDFPKLNESFARCDNKKRLMYDVINVTNVVTLVNKQKLV